ncbi:MAG: alginate export family protein [Candidatus Omnitrophica bacterium]|nr:alginate export family protein [Candidatus Omnitrophota bacterium]MDD5441154.1 alginate export family protein [Candidatus Omnitrophota bacterium]
MSRKLITLFAILCVTLSSAAFAGLQNIKVSGDITSQAIARDFGSDATASSYGEDSAYLLTQVRLRFDADLAEQVSATVALINERVWGSNGYSSSETDKNDIELDLAYVTLKQAFYDQLTLIVGRQNLYYGTGMIVGAPATNQTGDDYLYGDLSLSNGFDAVRAIIDLAPYTIDLVYAKVTEGSAYNSDDDVTLYGVNAAYDWSSYNGLTEAYFFAADNARVYNSGTLIDSTQSNTYVLGARTQFNPTDKTTLGIEGAWQFGDAYITGSVDTYRYAMAGNAFAQYRMLDKYNTTFGLCYAYFSGDDDLSDGRYSAWDPMFESQSPAEIMNLLVAQSGVQSLTASASFMPKEDITIKGSYTYAMLTYDYYSSTFTPDYGPAKNHSYSVNTDNWQLGSEVDAAILYDYTEDVQMSLNGAVFIPGNFFDGANDGDSTMYSLRGGITVSF